MSIEERMGDPSPQILSIVGIQEESQRDSFKECRLIPSRALWREGVSHYIWTFDRPAAVDDARVVALTDYFGTAPGEPEPQPGVDGWELINEGQAYSVDTMAATYLEEIPEEPVEESEQYQTYGDAKIITPYNESDYKGRLITVSIGANQFSKLWQPQQFPLATLIHQFTSHKIGKKDGLAIILGDMVKGQRKKQTIKTCTAIGLDIDTGTPSAEVDAALAKLGCLAIRSTTHSHGKQSSEIRKDSILKFSPDTDEITTELVREYLTEKERWHKSIVKTVKFVEEDHTDKGIVCRISHAPMPKHRVIVPVIHPYVIADEGRTQQEAMAKWAKVPAALAEMLGVPFDRSCTDPSRLYYLPRHDKSRPYEISLFGGPLFDLKTLRLDNAFDAIAAEFQKGGSKSVTAEGKALGKWWVKYAHGFQIMDVIEQFADDRKRSKATSGYNIECPFDSDHGNAGDSSDQACFAVNAADGGNEFFLVSCRHESCRDKTSNDMLGRMVKDEWFEEKVLYDQQWNVAEIEEEAPGAEPSNPADTFEAVQNEIAGLTKPFSPKSLERLQGLLEAWADEWQKSVLQKALATKTGIERDKVRSSTKKKSSAKKKTANNVNEKGTLLLDYVGKPDDVLIRDGFFAHIPTWNGTDGVVPSRPEQPLLTCLLDTPYELRITDGVARFAQLNPVGFRSMVTDMMLLRKLDDDGNPGPNEFIARDMTDVMHNRLWKVAPKTPELIRTPIISPEGKVLSKQGWHRANNADGEMQTNLFLYPGKLVVPRVSDKPTSEEVRKALALIYELIGDCKFCDLVGGGDNGKRASYANALAMLLTPFMRWYFKGWSPLFLIEKPDKGAGASTLAALLQIIFNGFTDSDTTYSDNESEMQKILVTEILKQKMFLWFENIESFSSRTLIQALTQDKVGGRILGLSESIERDNRFIWIATGIKPGLNGEMARRVCCIRLDPKEEDTQKTVYAKEDIKGWALLHRGELIWALLTLATNWIAEGAKPWKGDPEKALPLKSFENWSHVIGGILAEAGVTGFLENPRAASAGSKDHEQKIYAEELFHWMGFQEKTFTEISEQSVSAEYEGVTGYDKADKQKSVRKLLNSIHTRTLILGDARGQFKVQLHDGKDAHGRETYHFKNLDEQ